MLPINEKNKPDFNVMEHFMKNLKYEKLKGYLETKKIFNLTL